MQPRYLLLVVTALAALLAGCTTQEPGQTGSDASDTSQRPVVFATNYPVFYFATRLADGSVFDVRFPAPEDEDPAFWRPSAEIIAAMQAADMVLTNGATYEKWLATVSLPASLVVDTSAAFADDLLELEVKTTHSHGASGDHSHAGTDFNTWLDMDRAILQARAVAAALTRRLPAQADAINQRLAALEADLDALDNGFAEATKGARGQVVLASHPVYGYLAKRYGMRVSSFLWEPETMPNDEEWEAFERRKLAEAAEWMLYEDTPSTEIAERLTAAGIQVCVLRPCGNRPPEGDFLSEMKANIERLSEVYGNR